MPGRSRHSGQAGVNVDNDGARGPAPFGTPTADAPPPPVGLAPPGAAPQAPDPGGPPPRSRWTRRRWLTAWAVAVAVVGAIAAPAVVVTQAAGRGGADAAVQSEVPLEPGTTWIFDTTTNGTPTGTDVEQVTGKALVSSLAPNTVAVTDRF